MPIYRTLHLSDLHIGDTYIDSQSLAYKITNDIGRTGIKGIQSVLVTGDILNGPNGTDASLIREAADFFRTLMLELNQDSVETNLTKEDFLFVPGNHDIVWTEDKRVQWAKYLNFLNEFYGDIPSWYDLNDFSFCRPYPEYKLVFLGFNSCGLEKRKQHDDFVNCCQAIDEEKYLSHKIDKKRLLKLLEEENPEEFTDYGEISMQQFSKQRREMEKLDGYQAVAMFHHHFFLFPDNPNQLGDTDVVRHHSTVVQNLRSMQVKTILHGHKHFDLERPFINDDYYETTDSIIDVFAGGSVGAKGLQQHIFSVIDFYPEQDTIKLKQRKFIYREDELAPIRTIQIPPASKTAQVVRLLELMKNQNYDGYETYQAAIMSNTHFYQVCRNIIEWVGNALTGYSEVFRYLDRDNRYLLCLLYAIARRAIAYISAHSPDHGNNLAATQVMLTEFFKNYIASFVPNCYEELFDAPGLNQAAKLCTEVIDKQDNYYSKQCLAFSMVSILFTDLYLVLTEYADDFYHQISHKANIKLEPNLFHAHVPAPRIEIQSDADRRSAYVKMWCDDATAHKIAVLFVKEFDLAINKFEDFFKLIQLKLYYLLPQIDKNAALDTLDNYNFEAYIPTLLPLLIGEKIYHSKEVFARELVQNSIDAISVREAIEGRLNDDDRIIRIYLGTDFSRRKIFRIIDHGTGMDRYKVERYFTSIGRSFYSEEEYDELNIGYKPISSFGIGFLSSFMVCNEIDVRTRSFDGEQERLKLHIPNYEGCFFIERAKNAETGTEITLYLNQGETNPRQIIEYLKQSMRDIKYEIRITIENRSNCSIPAHQIRQISRQTNLGSTACLFIPFFENGIVGRLDWEQDIKSGKFADRDDCGLLIDLDCRKAEHAIPVLNSGIATGSYIYSSELFDENVNRFLRESVDSDQANRYGQIFSYNRFTFNFPSSWIQLDVSREKVVGFSAWMKKQHMQTDTTPYVQKEIAYALKEQLAGLLQSCKRDETCISVACVANLKSFLHVLEGEANESNRRVMDSEYTCQIEFTDCAVEFMLCYSQNTPKDFIVFNDIAKRKQAYARLDTKIKSKINAFADQPYFLHLFEYFLTRSPNINTTMTTSKLCFLGQETLYWMGIASLFSLVSFQRIKEKSELQKHFKTEYRRWEKHIRYTLMHSMTAGAVERGESKISVRYDDLFDSEYWLAFLNLAKRKLR